MGKARRIAFAVVDLTDNVQGEFPAQVITVSELNGKTIACMIERVAHSGQSFRIISPPDTTRWDHYALSLPERVLILTPRLS